jgi:nitrate/TMAO reductase-like tetraheme cytochrome c subunit
MKELEFYEEYIFYLDWRLSEKQITKGKYSLFKISKSEYDKFIKRLENDEKFNEKFVKLLQAEKRDEKIDSLISDDVFDDLDELFESVDKGQITKKAESKNNLKIDDIFDDIN